ncbi:MAG: AraC family transcriptional regulator [Rhizobiaceae bacterium]|nr:AraC family transcriptional regulator [Rhizobiaceae bacterium]
MPGGVVVALSCLSPLSMSRTAAQIADGKDNFVLSVPLDGEAPLYRAGPAEEICGPGDAFFFPGDETSFIANRRMSRLSLSIPRKMLQSAMRNPNRAARTRLPASPALKLLAGYAHALTQQTLKLTAELEAVAGNHVCDLVALALGPDVDGGDDARPGIKAARLRVIREDILRNLHRQDLSVEQMARQHGISPRYVQALFRGENTTFRDFVLAERLERAHAHLADPTFANLSISEIAFSCGFGDLSYFNQTFRRRYDMTPTDVRKANVL